jgi:hypothetical protein
MLNILRKIIIIQDQVELEIVYGDNLFLRINEIDKIYISKRNFKSKLFYSGIVLSIIIWVFIVLFNIISTFNSIIILVPLILFNPLHLLKFKIYSINFLLTSGEYKTIFFSKTKKHEMLEKLQIIRSILIDIQFRKTINV